MKRNLFGLFTSSVIALCLSVPCALAQQGSIVASPHNLSASGPGAIHAVSEQEICIFCHTPHNAAPVQPLWNRNVPVAGYIIYQSNSLQATPGQPTGSSKLCLSCHDGTIALGSVLSRDSTIAMAGGITTLPPGKSNLGTDLSDDHPISFRYDSALVVRNPKLKSPSALPQAVRLDHDSELQCTSCHDPHNDSRGNFLVMDNSASQLCNSCHQAGTTNVTGHAQCAACHQPHSAPSGPYLLKEVNVTGTCVACHASGATEPGGNIAADLQKIVRHDTNSPVNLAGHIPQNVVCNDCHQQHTMLSEAGAPNAPLISPRLGQIGGVNAAGAPIPLAQFQYEVCFKCHADQAATIQYTPANRQIVQTNTRLQFSSAAASYHPIEAPGRNMDVPSLLQPLTTASLIYCTDCHASNTSPAAGGSGASGPHGSDLRPLLVARYDTTDNTPESLHAYALCYRCHDRNSILGNESFPQHSLHVVQQQAPCSACHDAHGISELQGTIANNSHLINFDRSIVQQDPVTGKLEYDSLGMNSGRCFLNCHGVAHSPKSY